MAEDGRPAPEPTVEDRATLISRARTFLTSPQVQHQDISAKRQFLSDKGLTPSEIDELLREVPPLVPVIPPRTYPRPPPSNLPNLLLGIVRIFSWIAGGSAALLLLYYRFLLPRITLTFAARRSLKSHHVSLMRKLTVSLSSLKESQSESLSVLPRPDNATESQAFSRCATVEDILQEAEKQKLSMPDVPSISLLRSGIADSIRAKEGAVPTTEELFQLLESKIPWLSSEEGLQHENALWETLSTCPAFVSTSISSPDTPSASAPESLVWRHVIPEPPTPSPYLTSLKGLSHALPRSSAQKSNPFQHTLQSLSELTGYISTQLYVPYRPPPISGISSNTSLSPAEGEVKREIRALKGLVLNRRSFMPTTNGGLPSPVQRAT